MTIAFHRIEHGLRLSDVVLHQFTLGDWRPVCSAVLGRRLPGEFLQRSTRDAHAGPIHGWDEEDRIRAGDKPATAQRRQFEAFQLHLMRDEEIVETVVSGAGSAHAEGVPRVLNHHVLAASGERHGRPRLSRFRLNAGDETVGQDIVGRVNARGPGVAAIDDPAAVDRPSLTLRREPTGGDGEVFCGHAGIEDSAGGVLRQPRRQPG